MRRSDDAHSAIEYPTKSASTYACHLQCMPTKVPLVLSRIFPRNRVGLKELSTPYRTLLAFRGGRGEMLKISLFSINMRIRLWR